MKTTITKVVLGLASMTMLVACASTVTAEKAKEIAEGWVDTGKFSEADTKFDKAVTTTKDSDGNSRTANADVGLTYITVHVAANVAIVGAAAAIEGTEFKADGTALEFTYKDGGDTTEPTTYTYKMNEYGLTTYMKVATGSTWTETTTTYSK